MRSAIARYLDCRPAPRRAAPETNHLLLLTAPGHSGVDLFSYNAVITVPSDSPGPPCLVSTSPESSYRISIRIGRRFRERAFVVRSAITARPLMLRRQEQPVAAYQSNHRHLRHPMLLVATHPPVLR